MEIARYLEIDGRPAVQLVRHLPHPVARVWAAATDPNELAHWFPSTVAIELTDGGRITFRGDPNMPESTGTVLSVRPPHELRFSWGGDELWFTLAASDGGCTFTLTDILEARDTAARNGSGWTICAEELARTLDGAGSEGPHGSRALPFDPIYEAHVDAGVPSGASIPGR